MGYSTNIGIECAEKAGTVLAGAILGDNPPRSVQMFWRGQFDKLENQEAAVFQWKQGFEESCELEQGYTLLNVLFGEEAALGLHTAQ